MSANWTVNIRMEPGFRRFLKVRWLRQIATTVLAAEKVEAGVKLSLVVTGDETVKELNCKYRGKNRTTDVLSFPLIEEGSDFASPPGAIKHLGEVVISCPQAIRQAEAAGHTPEKEVAWLIVHGVLHVLGYDHLNSAQRQRMRDREQAILAQIFS